MTKNFKNLITAVIVIAGVLAVGAFLYLRQGQNQTSSSKELLSSQQAAEKAINYINKNVLSQGLSASLVNVIDEGQVYKIYLKIGENEYQSYISKDGKYLFPEGYDLAVELGNPEESPDNQEITKREEPDVKLFVMSYCPYGLQAQKMFLP